MRAGDDGNAGIRVKWFAHLPTWPSTLETHNIPADRFMDQPREPRGNLLIPHRRFFCSSRTAKLSTPRRKKGAEESRGGETKKLRRENSWEGSGGLVAGESKWQETGRIDKILRRFFSAGNSWCRGSGNLFRVRIPSSDLFKRALVPPV